MQVNILHIARSFYCRTDPAGTMASSGHDLLRIRCPTGDCGEGSSCVSCWAALGDAVDEAYAMVSAVESWAHADYPYSMKLQANRESAFIKPYFAVQNSFMITMRVSAQPRKYLFTYSE